PLFAHLDGKLLTRKQFIDKLKSRVEQEGIDSTRFSGHSFRRGAAVGYTNHEIQLLGRWHSD
ncbi:hypothetical protein P691DRAFT_609570, partial [Macrolepiota fuliginosa MF-IS2]